MDKQHVHLFLLYDSLNGVFGFSHLYNREEKIANHHRYSSYGKLVMPSEENYLSKTFQSYYAAWEWFRKIQIEHEITERDYNLYLDTHNHKRKVIENVV